MGIHPTCHRSPRRHGWPTGPWIHSIIPICHIWFGSRTGGPNNITTSEHFRLRYPSTHQIGTSQPCHINVWHSPLYGRHIGERQLLYLHIYHYHGISSDIRQGNGGRLLKQLLCTFNVHFHWRQIYYNIKGDSSVPMDQHSTPIQKPHSHGRTVVQVQCSTPLSRMSNRYAKEMWFIRIQQSLYFPTCATL